MTEDNLHYIDPFSILFVDSSGNLNRLLCPFKVEPFVESNCKKTVIVEMVLKNPDNEILFVVDGKGYNHYHFKINSS